MVWLPGCAAGRPRRSRSLRTSGVSWVMLHILSALLELTKRTACIQRNQRSKLMTLPHYFTGRGFYIVLKMFLKGNATRQMCFVTIPPPFLLMPYAQLDVCVFLLSVCPLRAFVFDPFGPDNLLTLQESIII